MKNSQGFISNDPGDYRCFVFKMATPQQKSQCIQQSAKKDCNMFTTCISHRISHGTTKPSMHLHLVEEIRAEKKVNFQAHSCITHRGLTRTLLFANAPFMFKFDVPGINGHLDG
jgi:hypothetical protein